MNPVEKAVFSLTRAILGNKKARTAFILYACALHLLVLYTTWECALSGDSQGQFEKQRNPFVRSLPSYRSSPSQLFSPSNDATVHLMTTHNTCYYGIRRRSH